MRPKEGTDIPGRAGEGMPARRLQSALVALREQSKTTASQSQDLDKRQQLAQELTQLQNQISSSQRQLEEAQKVDALTDPGQKKEEITSRRTKTDQDINDLNEKINQLTNDFQNLQQQWPKMTSGELPASRATRAVSCRMARRYEM
jgi:chromosome segregation ATPase